MVWVIVFIMHKSFTKMHGAGNDFVIAEPQFFGLDNYRTKLSTFAPEQQTKIIKVVREICRPKFGVGADGLLIVSSLGEGQFKMTVYNSDSSFATMCGNGLRCVAAYLYDRKGTGPNFTVSTDSGDKRVAVERKTPKLFWVTTNLGAPSLPAEYDTSKIEEDPLFKSYLPSSKIYRVSLGNEHLFVLLPNVCLEAIEKNNAFLAISEVLRAGNPFNVNFCSVTAPSALRIVTCENGAGMTLACGTGSASSAFAAFKIGVLPGEVSIETRGGLLASRIVTTAEGREEVELSGPAQQVFTGTISQY